jgi:hypothetical protein
MHSNRSSVEARDLDALELYGPTRDWDGDDDDNPTRQVEYFEWTVGFYYAKAVIAFRGRPRV